MKKIKFSILTSFLLLSFAGCSITGKNQETSVEQTKNQETIDLLKEKKSIQRTINIKTGDNTRTIFDRLSSIDNKTYIINQDSNFSSKISVNGIPNLEELKKFFKANDYILESENVEDSSYVKIKVKQTLSTVENKLKNTTISINGTVPIDDMIKMISNNSKIEIVYDDKTASNISKINRSINFNGDGLSALKEITNSVDLSVDFKDDKAIVSYFKTETMNLDIFTRDRATSTKIEIAMSNTSSNDSNSNSTNSSSSTTDSSTSDKDLSITYKTEQVKDLVKSLDSIISEHGSYTLLPSSGQILIRDKGTNVKLAQKLVSDFNSQFKDTIEMTLTFYKVVTDKGDKRGLDFSALGSKLDFKASGMATNAFGTSSNYFSLAAKNFSGESNSILSFLSEYGQAEVLNPVSFETQSNVLKTVKIANNYGYISSVKQSTTSNTTSTSEITPNSVADGGFISVIAKPIGNDFIAVDLYSTTTSLTKFNSVTIMDSTVQTPDTAEQSIDGYHQVKAGVPFILVSHKYEENKANTAGLPIEKLKSLGLDSEQSKNIYIVIVLEAKVRS